jgi:phosphoglycerate dehydrogenase-like enzyme
VVALKRTAVPPTSDGAHEIDTHDTLHAHLPRAGALIICLPATPATDGLIGQAELDLLPPNALLVNIGRGPIVDEGALYRALRDRKLFAAGLDVWWRYPQDVDGRAHTPPANYPFHELDNVVMTPHKGGDALEVDQLRMQHLARLLNAAAAGQPIPNRVSLERGY